MDFKVILVLVTNSIAQFVDDHISEICQRYNPVGDLYFFK